MDDELLLDPEDVTREYPAARCRDCGVITHVCTASGVLRRYECKNCKTLKRTCKHGAKRVASRDVAESMETPPKPLKEATQKQLAVDQRELFDDGNWELVPCSHAKKCTRPISRADLLIVMRDQAPELEDETLGTRLCKSMTDDEVRQVAKELLAYLRSRA